MTAKYTWTPIKEYKEILFQKFEVSGREFVKHQHAFLRKCDQYYKNVSYAKEAQDTKNDE